VNYALPPRIEAKIIRKGGCWLWQGWTEKRAPRKLSYGKVWWEGTMRYAHRVIYTLVIGPIPEGMQLDHVKERGCIGPPCVNPFHMEPVTAKENVKRGNTGQNMVARITCHCGSCSTCKGRMYMRRHRAKRA
jgi:hypothetical protein